MNVDGAFSNDLNMAACGGLLRNRDGTFLQGFVAKLHEGDALYAELWACILGLELAWDMGHRRVEVESDSKHAVELLKRAVREEHQEFETIIAAKHLIDRDWDLHFIHVNRESNQAADFLVK